MTADKPVTKYRKDYTPTPYLIDSISLDFTLTEDFARVIAVSKVKLNHEGAQSGLPVQFSISDLHSADGILSQFSYKGAVQGSRSRCA